MEQNVCDKVSEAMNKCNRCFREVLRKINLPNIKSILKGAGEKMGRKDCRDAAWKRLQMYVTAIRFWITELWRQGIKGKVMVGGCAVVLLWGVKSCLFGFDGAEGVRFSAADFEKAVNSDELFYEGSEKDPRGYVKVLPNLRAIPKMLRGDSICASMNPTIEQGDLHQKGYAYFNDADFIYKAIVVHVAKDYIVVAPDSTTMYGNFHAVIHTAQEYFERQSLRTGFYVLIGRERLPLVNGSTETMYAYQELDEESNRLAVDAVIYNGKAKEAAEKENDRRLERVLKEKEKRDTAAREKWIREEQERFTKLSETAYRKYVDTFDKGCALKRFHMAPQLREVISCSVDPMWRYDNQNLNASQMKEVIEKKGWGVVATELMNITECGKRCEIIDAYTKDFFTKCLCKFEVRCGDPQQKYRVFVIDGKERIRINEPRFGDYGKLFPGEEVYIAGGDEDLDIKQFGCDEVQVGGRLGGEKSKFQDAFEKRYGKGK